MFPSVFGTVEALALLKWSSLLKPVCHENEALRPITEITVALDKIVGGLPDPSTNARTKFLQVAWYASHVSASKDGSTHMFWLAKNPQYVTRLPTPDDTTVRLAHAIVFMRTFVMRVHAYLKSTEGPPAGGRVMDDETLRELVETFDGACEFIRRELCTVEDPTQSDRNEPS